MLAAVRTLLYFIALGSIALAGCRAEVKTQADFSASVRADSDSPEDDDGMFEPEPQAPVKTLAVAEASEPKKPLRAAFIGVTPDLTLVPAKERDASCMCLALAHGAPGSSAFQWEGGVPESSQNSMAVAISGEGVDCDWGEGDVEVPIPSIAGVERSGDDVILTVEPAQPGRPIMQGAMVLKPNAKGSLIVQGRGRVPFGRPASGAAGSCRIAVN